MILTKLMIKIKGYSGWCRGAYEFYREILGHSRYRAWRGAFTLPAWKVQKEFDEREANSG